MKLCNAPPSNALPVAPSRIATLVCLLLLGLSVIGRATAQDAEPLVAPSSAVPVPPAIHASTASDTLNLTVGRSVVLSSATPLRRIYVSNPAVLQSYTSGETEVVLTAKSAGISGLVLWDELGGHRLYAVTADLDPNALRASLDAAFPGSTIHADTGEGRIFLTGSVATDAASEAAFKMASLYTKDVVNSLRVVPEHGKQVQIKLRFVEVDRTRLDQFGVNIFSGGRTAIATSTQQFSNAVTGSGSSITVSDPLNIFLYNSKLDVGLTVKDLEQKQILQVLAEPTLTTLSGLTARFLSGGEFPFPVVEGGTGSSTAITIQFRPYGVKVDCTPTVNPDGSIRLKLAPEVSTLDYGNSVTISGFTIPALATRRAETEIEIQNGQSFIVSGILDHRTTEIMNKDPGIGSVPILGELFRSKNFNHSVVELVIIVTANVVDPLSSTAQTEPSQPKLAVPNLDSATFDAWARSKPEAGIASPEPQSQPETSTKPQSQTQPQTQPNPPAPVVRTDQP